MKAKIYLADQQFSRRIKILQINFPLIVIINNKQLTIISHEVLRRITVNDTRLDLKKSCIFLIAPWNYKLFSANSQNGLENIMEKLGFIQCGALNSLLCAPCARYAEVGNSILSDPTRCVFCHCFISN